MSTKPDPNKPARKRTRSIVTRITLFVALVGVLSFGTQVLVLTFWMGPISEELVSVLTSHVRSIRTSMQMSSPEQRSDLAAKLSTQSQLVQAGSMRTRLGESPAEGSPLRFIERFQNALGDDAKVMVERTDMRTPLLHFEFDIDNQPWTFSYRATPPVFAVTNTLLIWLSVFVVIVFAGLIFGVRLIARPISGLVEQISSQRGSIQPIHAGPRAGTEIQSIAYAFNSLVESIEQSNATKQQLLAGVSHDLRTPLSRLRLRIETECDPALAQLMEADLMALERITNQFLAYVKGDLSTETGPTAALAPLCQTVVAQYTAEGREVHLRCTGNATFAVPELAVRRMLTNLIDNALAHGKAPVAVEVDAQTDAVTITVCDQGAGMTEAQFASALQPFVRLNPARNTLGHCGLGLAIVAQIANQLRAKVSVRPRSGDAPFGVSVSWPTRTRS
jgi:two-component system, OmpR family, osmolarity sensor histidine kinase EnvZ